MGYTVYTVSTTGAAADLVADVLFTAGAGGVEIEDIDDLKAVAENLRDSEVITDELLEKMTSVLKSRSASKESRSGQTDPHSCNFEKAQDDATFGDDEGNADCTFDEVQVKTVLPADSADEFEKELKAGLELLAQYADVPLGSLTVTKEDEKHTDWREEWKKHFKPIVTKKITVVPIWQQYEKGKNEQVFLIDPGMAFGTGEHETTRMCLDFMPEVSGKTVADIGCGSGILGLSAALLGAKAVYMSDIDPSAVKTAKQNMHLNGLDGANIEILCADLTEKAEVQADIVFANITADILIDLSKSILKVLKSSGLIVLSGIIHSRLSDVKAAYEAQGLRVVDEKKDGEWNAVVLKRG